MVKMKSSQEIDIHFQALCNAVEHEKLEKAKSILEQHPELRLDSLNGDGFTPLDLAFMTGNSDILRLLLQHRLDDEDDLDDENEDDDEGNEEDNNTSLLEGRHPGRAVEGDVFASPDAVSAHLKNLMQESKKQVEKFGQLIKAASSNQPVSVIATTLGTSAAGLLNTTAAAASLTPAQLKECEKQQNLWHKRLLSLKKMLSCFQASGCPHAPSNVLVSVIGQTSIKVQVNEPEPVGPHSLFTKFKVQWSHLDTFAKISGERIVICSSDEGQRQECLIDNLEEGKRYFVRASFGNPKGFGPFSASSPKSVVPSTWRSVDKKQPRIKNQMDLCVDVLDGLMSQLNNEELELPDASVKVKRKGILHLFTGGVPKFQKSVAANRLHVSCVLFHEDRVLMTNDDALPMVVVDEPLSGGGTGLTGHQLQHEFHWFAKLCHMWDDVPKLKREMAKVANGGGSHRSVTSLTGAAGNNSISFRLKILQAVLTLQTQLAGLDNDLGSAYWHPFFDQGTSGNGSVIFTAVRHVRYPKSLVTLSLKWVHLSRVQRSSARLPDLPSAHTEDSCMEHLRNTIRHQLLFNQVCNISLNRGLFLCYLQARSTVDGTIEVAVCNTSPSILPYIKLRDNPHVNSDEWAWIHRLSASNGIPIAKHFRKQSSIHAPSPTTNFLAIESEDGEENSIGLTPTEEQYVFGRMLDKGMERLFEYLEISSNDRQKHRLYYHEVIELSDDVSVVLVLPPPQSVCFLQTSEDSSGSSVGCSINLKRNDFLMLPLPMFELVHLGAYHIELLVTYIRVMSFLDLELVLAKQIHREAITTEEADLAQRRLSTMHEQHHLLEEAWRSMRWIPDVINQARSRTIHCGLTYENLSSWYARQTDLPDDAAAFASTANTSNGSSEYYSAGGYVSRRQSNFSIGSASKQMLSRTPTTRSDPSELKASMDDSYVRYYSVRPDGKVVPEDKENWTLERRDQDQPKKKKSLMKEYDTYTTSRDGRKYSLQHFHSEQLLQQAQQHQQFNNSRLNYTAENSTPTQTGWKVGESVTNGPGMKFEPNVLQVYAAYHSGLANGTSVKLNVTHATTAREVVDLVVKQLNMAVILKGRDGPIYEKDELKNFCLVAVIGSRERCLRDDFRPLNLQNPWKSGKLFVRMKNDLLAAFERTSIENNPVSETNITSTTTLL